MHLKGSSSCGETVDPPAGARGEYPECCPDGILVDVIRHALPAGRDKVAVLEAEGYFPIWGPQRILHATYWIKYNSRREE